MVDNQTVRGAGGSADAGAAGAAADLAPAGVPGAGTACSAHRTVGGPGAGRRGRGRLSVGDDVGMATAEYAVGTLAAVGFAGLLFAVLRSGEVQTLLLEIVRRALGAV